MTAIGDSTPVKTCTKCGQCKSTQDFYRSSSAKDGFAVWCKSCDKEAGRRRKLSPEKIEELDRYKALHELGRKQCNACGQVKDHAEFHARADRNNEVLSRCKICQSEYRAKKWAEDPDKSKQISKKKYAATAEQQKAKKRAAYWSDPEKYSLINKQNREKYRDAILAGQKAWYQANRDQQVARGRAHYQANKQAYIEGNKRRKKARVKCDPVFALSQRIRSLIYSRIYSGGYTKKSRSQEILGCSWDYFKRHIELQFLPGMSWDKLGEIHLDHIIPMATAKTEEDVIRLNHFTNIRPIWAKDNLSKGAQITHLI
jgi:hypothetical protein